MDCLGTEDYESKAGTTIWITVDRLNPHRNA